MTDTIREAATVLALGMAVAAATMLLAVIAGAGAHYGWALAGAVA